MRDFGLLMAAVIGGVFGLLIPYWKRGEISAMPLVIAAVFAFLGLVLPGVLKPIFRVWMIIGNVLGAINSRIILGVVFFIVLTPVALLMKIFNRDALRLSRDENTKSYRVSRRMVVDPKIGMERPY